MSASLASFFREHRTRLILAAVLCLALAVRLWKVTEKGFLQYDEAYYALEAGTASLAGEWTLDHWRELASGKLAFSDLKEDLRESGALFPLGTAKPIFLWTLSLANLVMGRHDYTSFVFSTLWGVALLLMIFLVARSVWNDRTAWFSLMLAFFSVEHLHYSRSGYSQTQAAFFLLASVYLAVRERFFLAGLLLGLAFATHYCILFTVVPFAAWLLIFHRRKTAPFFLGFALPVAAVEAVYRIEGQVLGPWLSDVKFLTYGEHILRQMLWSSRGEGSLLHHDFLLPLRMLAVPEGPLLFAAALSFLAIPLWKRHSFPSGAWLVWFAGWGSLFLWMLSPGILAPRALFPAWMAALAGSGLAVAAFRNRAVRILLLAAAGTFALAMRFPGILEMKTGYREASRWLRERGQSEVVELFMWPVYQYHLGRKIHANSDRVTTLEELKTYYQKGIIYLSTDFSTTLGDPVRWKFIFDITSTLEPAAVFPAGVLEIPWMRYHFLFTDAEAARAARLPAVQKDIRIFDLRGYFPDAPVSDRLQQQ